MIKINNLAEFHDWDQNDTKPFHNPFGSKRELFYTGNNEMYESAFSAVDAGQDYAEFASTMKRVFSFAWQIQVAIATMTEFDGKVQKVHMLEQEIRRLLPDTPHEFITRMLDISHRVYVRNGTESDLHNYTEYLVRDAYRLAEINSIVDDGRDAAFNALLTAEPMESDNEVCMYKLDSSGRLVSAISVIQNLPSIN